MLEGVAIILRVVIELVGICEEIISGTKRITATYVRARESDTFGLLNGEHILGRTIERLAHFIADIGIRILIGDDLHGVLNTRGAMIRSEHQGKAQFRSTS